MLRRDRPHSLPALVALVAALAPAAGRAAPQIPRGDRFARMRSVRAHAAARKATIEELDWIEHVHPELGRAKVISERREGNEIVRRTMIDFPIDPTKSSHIPGGRFQRRMIEQRFRVARGKRPWLIESIPHLVSFERQGVLYDTAHDKVTARLFQPDALAVDLVIEGDRKPHALRPKASGLWEIQLGTMPRRLYGKEYHFRVTRPDGSMIALADPYADLTERTGGTDIISRFADMEFRWRDQSFRRPALEDLMIYEAHLPALSRHASSGVPDELRGTYRGATFKRIRDHLRRLQVAVELLPVRAKDPLMAGDWGYHETSFTAPNEGYAQPAARLNTNRELMALVDSYHRAGIPVGFDVVYNHGGDLYVRAFGQDIMYRRLPDGHFDEGSGVGPTVRSEHPVVQEMILQTLEHLVATYHVDFLRFDLGALLDKRTMRRIARRLPQEVHLFAEPWALAHAKWDKGDLKTTFADTRWAVWNDDFREPVKAFINGRADGPDNRDKVMTAIGGNYSWISRPNQSVNYFAVHDGPTSADAVGGDRSRLFQGVVLTALSQGVPMISEGTEFMHSKGGEENSYDRSDLNQLDWEKAAQHTDLTDAIANVIALRKALPHFRYGHPLVAGRDIDWIFPNGWPHHDNVNALGFVLRPPAGTRAPAGLGELLVLSNGSHQPTEFHVPAGRWKVIVDGRTLEVNKDGIGQIVDQEHYYVHPGTVIVLARDRG